MSTDSWCRRILTLDGAGVGAHAIGPLGLAACWLLGAAALVAQAAPVPTVTHLRAWRAELGAPTRLALDAAGNLLIADPRGGQVVVRAPDGRVLERRRGLGPVVSLAVDAGGRVLVGNSEHGTVSVYGPDWRLLLRLGIGDGEFQLPCDLVTEPASGRIYVADSGRNQVRVYEAFGALLFSFDGSNAPGGPLGFIAGLTLAGGKVFVIDQENHKIVVFDRDGVFLNDFGQRGDLPGEIYTPQGLWHDDAGRLWVADARLGRLSAFDATSGDFLGSVGRFGAGAGRLAVPTHLAIDSMGRMFVASADNARIEMFGLGTFSDPERYVPARAQVRLLGQGPASRLVAIITIPGYSANAVDRTTVVANGIAALATTVADHDGDHLLDIRALFDPQQVAAAANVLGRPDVVLEGAVSNLRFLAEAPNVFALFADGFESGDLSAWSTALGGPAAAGGGP